MTTYPAIDVEHDGGGAITNLVVKTGRGKDLKDKTTCRKRPSLG